MTVLIASNNPKKLKELSAILKDLGVDAVSLSEAGVDSNPEETGEAFEENALIKASAAARASGLWAVADDSGLCVDALGGQPGVFSARFGGEGLDDASRNTLLLSRLEGVPPEKRGASFVSVIALATPDGQHFTVRGQCRGLILTAPAGSHGFGYDPIFYVPALGRTFAELPADVKNSVSHRARALALFKERFVKFESSYGAAFRRTDGATVNGGHA